MLMSDNAEEGDQFGTAARISGKQHGSRQQPHAPATLWCSWVKEVAETFPLPVASMYYLLDCVHRSSAGVCPASSTPSSRIAPSTNTAVTDTVKGTIVMRCLWHQFRVGSML
ncbi:expressed unknown protein [Seminavis robusta]|uniref:Uncharacterized protein n=1 Tax=Seminavis robusta TaxID=568900 RepID=A0A9N8HUE2_9STRA|nr:expressed unknown protein [Seminavis robusta]|eukprot:Sro1372_g267161.1  (112) ;mRNA; r:12963-13298